MSTLCNSGPSVGYRAWSSRSELLRTQAAQHNFLFLQETRSRSTGLWRSWPWYGFTAASEKGYGGCEVWINAEACFAVAHAAGMDAQRIFLLEQYWRVEIAQSRLLVVRFRSPAWNMLLVSGHAPHEGAECHAKDAWWARLASVLAKYPAWPVVLGCDFNARLGEFADRWVGSHKPDPENDNGARLHRMLQQANLFLPSTFPSTQWLGPLDKGAWKSPMQWERLDFLALPVEWQSAECTMQIDALQLDHSADDHMSLSLSCKCLLQDNWVARASPSRQQFDRSALRTSTGRDACARIIDNLAAQVGPALWRTSVDSHVLFCEQFLSHQLSSAFPKQRRAKRSTWISDHSWHLLGWSRKLRRSAAAAKLACKHA